MNEGRKEMAVAGRLRMKWVKVLGWVMVLVGWFGGGTFLLDEVWDRRREEVLVG